MGKPLNYERKFRGSTCEPGNAAVGIHLVEHHDRHLIEWWQRFTEGSKRVGAPVVPFNVWVKTFARFHLPTTTSRKRNGIKGLLGRKSKAPITLAGMKK